MFKGCYIEPIIRNEELLTLQNGILTTVIEPGADLSKCFYSDDEISQHISKILEHAGCKYRVKAVPMKSCERRDLLGAFQTMWC